MNPNTVLNLLIIGVAVMGGMLIYYANTWRPIVIGAVMMLAALGVAFARLLVFP